MMQGRAAEAKVQLVHAYRRNPMSAKSAIAQAFAAIIDGEIIEANEFIERGLAIESNQPYVQWSEILAPTDCESGILVVHFLPHRNAPNHDPTSEYRHHHDRPATGGCL